MKKNAILLLFFLLFYPIFAADIPVEEKYIFNIMPLPAVYYTPETGIAFGAAALYTGFPESLSMTTKKDTGIFSVVYTEKKQLCIDLNTEKYFDKGSLYLNAHPIFSYYPYFFWGLGPDTKREDAENYTYTEGEFTSSLLKSITAGMKLGVYYKFNRYEISGLKTGGLLDSGAVAGGHNGTMSALGMRFIYDSRDRRFSTGNGYVADIMAAASLKALGSSADFYIFEGEGKAFYTLFPENILCFDAILRLAGKGTPFRYIPMLGGLYYMRGYYEGRYVDYAYTALEAEYRFPIWWTFRGSLFATAGQVAPDIMSFKTEGIKGAWGFGLHWTPLDFMDSPLRFELAFARGDMQLYIDLVESF